MHTFRVTWVIDVEAKNEMEAAQKAYNARVEEDSIANVFTVQKWKDNNPPVTIDFMELDGLKEDIAERRKELSDLHTWVDIPQLDKEGKPDDSFRNVASFPNQADAIKYAQEHFGADEQGRISLISPSFNTDMYIRQQLHKSLNAE